LAGGAALAAAPGVPTTSAPLAARLRTVSVEVLGPGLRPHGRLTGRWTTAGGNDSEVLVAATEGGGLLELGGVEPRESPDGGPSWMAVTVLTPSPLGAGEGDVVPAPAGTAYGVLWNVYAGDHLQWANRDASGSWAVGELPLHVPLADRPWVTYAKGPFVVGGTWTSFVTLVHVNSTQRGMDLLSADGSTYLPSTPSRDVGAAPAVPLRIPVVREPAADYWQPNPAAHTVPLSGGGLLLLDYEEEGLGCPVAQLDPARGTWRCVSLSFPVPAALRQDSRGWLTALDPAGSGFVLGLSPDGGRTWRRAALPAPPGLRAGPDEGWDVKANGRLGRAVVVSRLYDAGGRGHDVVWDVDTSRAQPAVRRVLLVGKGDWVNQTFATASSTDRFDFSSVALLPSGRIAVSFMDSTTPRDSYGDGAPGPGRSPAVAVIP
jgi:hypothetical protein